MAAAQGLYAETISDVISTDVSGGWLDCAEIAAGSFTASGKYLIVALAYLSSNSATLEKRARLVHGPDGSEAAFTDATYDIEGGGAGANAGDLASWMYVWDQPGTAEQVKVQIASTGADDVTCHLSQIFALRLDDLAASDWTYAEVTTDYTNTATFADQAAVTFTPNGTDGWLLIGHVVWDVNDAANQFEARLNDSVAGALEPLLSLEGEDAATEERCGLLVRAQTPSAASHTFSVQARNDVIGTANVVLSSRIFALRLNAFRQHFAEYTEAEITTLDAMTNAETATVTPDVTGDWFYIGSVTADEKTGVTNEFRIRLQDDNDGSMGSDPAYGDDQPQDWAMDSTDQFPFQIFKLKSLTSGGPRTINVDAQLTTGGAFEDRGLYGFSLELPAAGAATRVQRLTLLGAG